MAEFHYHLSTHTKEQYDALDASLRDPDDPTYVAREVEQTNDILHSPTRGVFWLSEEEAAELEKDPQISFIHKDPDSYPDEFPQPSSDELHCAIEETYRYNEPVKHRNRFASQSDYPTSPTSADLRRCGYQLLRTTSENGPKAKRDIWSSDAVTETANIKKTGTGKDVDIICMDNGSWIGHIEFINNRPADESPTDYIGGNVLPGDGICDCLSLVHDGPYYIDPDWFDAAPGSRLETRWDGTTVPTDQAAIDWWGSTSNRSAAFSSYGTVAVPSYYTRLRAHGDYNTDTSNGTHGTQCASQIFGRTHGWAYNANKWIIDGYSTYGLGLTRVWDVQKIFHQAKPTNPKYGTKDPTLSSNSWGYRATPGSTGYGFHRTGSGLSYTSDSNKPQFMRYVGDTGDSGRMKSEFLDSAIVTSAKEMVDAGVITVVAAGNGNQKQVQWDHADYDNYWHTSSSGHFGDGINITQFGYQVMPTTNRAGFPQHAGATFGDPKTWNITVNNAGSGAYTMSGTDRNGAVSGSNPTITIHRGDTVNFNVSASGHPFYINHTAGTGTGNAVQYPTASGQGAQNGTVTWSPNQRTASSTGGEQFYYNCQYHGSMQGTINVQSGNRTSPVINVGCLDDQYATGTKERKVNYSDMGNNIDLFSPGDGSLAATVGTYGTDIPRFDNTYLSKTNNTTWGDGTTGSPSTSRDVRFSGTSSACPIACGLIATIVEFNRSWSVTDIKTWLGTLNVQDTTNDFYDGVEDTGATDAGHSDYNKLQGATARVIYQGGTFSHTTKETTTKDVTLGNGIGFSGAWNIQRD
tara:strand:+ start:1002 stop:3410 length:2409 start_codon:yes stop_codon:yes gene_type:complete